MLVRALLPFGVAAVLALAATVVVGVISLPAAAMVAICLLVAGIRRAMAGRQGGRRTGSGCRQHHSDRDMSAMLALEHAPELRVAGRLPSVIAGIATPPTRLG